MLVKEVSIINKLGLHARASAKLVTTALQFESTIEVAFGGRKINGKSIMGVMMLAAAKGSVIRLEINGPDEADAMDALVALINNRFGEYQ